MMTIDHDKGNPAAKQERNAVSLLGLLMLATDARQPPWQIVWLPKAIGVDFPLKFYDAKQHEPHIAASPPPFCSLTAQI